MLARIRNETYEPRSYTKRVKLGVLNTDPEPKKRKETALPAPSGVWDPETNRLMDRQIRNLDAAGADGDFSGLPRIKRGKDRHGYLR